MTASPRPTGNWAIDDLIAALIRANDELEQDALGIRLEVIDRAAELIGHLTADRDKALQRIQAAPHSPGCWQSHFNYGIYCDCWKAGL